MTTHQVGTDSQPGNGSRPRPYPVTEFSSLSTRRFVSARSLARQVVEGKLVPEDIDEDRVSQNLYDPDMPGVDLLIRTGGEQRLSDFLLWECAYAELLFVHRMWPDFDAHDLAAAVRDFRSRERRFGQVAVAG